jgi:hypothetical protein
MAIYRLLENAVYDPAKVRVMIEAYECACRELELTGRKADLVAEVVTEMVASKILEITQEEANPDPQQICDRSLRELGMSP